MQLLAVAMGNLEELSTTCPDFSDVAGLGWSGKGQIVCAITSPPFGGCALGNGEVTGGNALGQ